MMATGGRRWRALLTAHIYHQRPQNCRKNAVIRSQKSLMRAEKFRFKVCEKSEKTMKKRVFRKYLEKYNFENFYFVHKKFCFIKRNNFCILPKILGPIFWNVGS